MPTLAGASLSAKQRFAAIDRVRSSLGSPAEKTSIKRTDTASGSGHVRFSVHKGTVKYKKK